VVIVRLEELDQLKYAMTPSGIEPTTLELGIIIKNYSEQKSCESFLFAALIGNILTPENY
jgi:hypothetical protein